MFATGLLFFSCSVPSDFTDIVATNVEKRGKPGILIEFYEPRKLLEKLVNYQGILHNFR